jgi:tRNA threonylcarbamoyladenosine biosynthesis protein TsaB
MRVLALDTTTRVGSVAIVEDERVIEARCGDPQRTHAERLPADILALAADNGIALRDIDVFAVASGPGSFTGLRIGIATIQGFAFVMRRGVVAVSALEALGQLGSADRMAGTVVAAWMDAHRHEVFAALYCVGSGTVFGPQRLIEVEGPSVGDPRAMLGRWVSHLVARTTVFIGDGAELYGDVIRDCIGPAAVIIEMPPLAAAIGRVAVDRAGAGQTMDPAALHPLYVRRPDAEIAQDRKRD